MLNMEKHNYNNQNVHCNVSFLFLISIWFNSVNKHTFSPGNFRTGSVILTPIIIIKLQLQLILTIFIENAKLEQTLIQSALDGALWDLSRKQSARLS